MNSGCVMKTTCFVPDQPADSDRDDQAQTQAGRDASFVCRARLMGVSVRPAAIAIANFAGVDRMQVLLLYRNG